LNYYGQLGLRDKNERSYPEIIRKSPEGGAKFIKISCGESNTLLLDNKNQV